MGSIPGRGAMIPACCTARPKKKKNQGLNTFMGPQSFSPGQCRGSLPSSTAVTNTYVLSGSGNILPVESEVMSLTSFMSLLRSRSQAFFEL